MHTQSGLPVRALVTHQRGGDAAQLRSLADFALEGLPPDAVVVVCGDFNEDFGAGAMLPCGGMSQAGKGGGDPVFRTLDRDAASEPIVSRPAHKQGPAQTSGKGKIDYIFVRGAGPGMCVELERDALSRAAVLASHAPCDETGYWPSDHGMEALSVHVSRQGLGS